MASINIGSSNSQDQFYRYKRPQLVARIEGRGNGIKTNVVNNVDLAKALERPPEYVLKFFGCELGAQTKYDASTGNSIVNGAHDVAKLDALLELFIKKYVQCHACGNPETRIKIRKDMIHLMCKACGNKSDVDMRHKLNTFILKNPPDDKISKAEKRLKKMEAERLQEASGDKLDEEAKAKRKKEKEKKKTKDGKGKKDGGDSPDPSANEEADETGVDNDDDDDDGGEDDVVWMTDTSQAAVAARAAAQLTGATAEMVTQGNLEAERLEEEKRQEKARKREEARLAAEREAAEEHARAEAARLKEVEEKRLAEEAKAKMSLADSGGVDEAAVAKMRELVAAGNPKKAADRLRRLDVEGGVPARMRILLQALFGNLGSHKLAPAVEARAEFLTAAVGDDGPAQLAQLLALEWLLGVGMPDKLKEAPLAVKALYDEDVADEGIILAWFGKANAAKSLGVEPDVAAAVRAAVKPFIEWLQNAESEGDESESDDEYGPDLDED